jgi:hypothetical protein
MKRKKNGHIYVNLKKLFLRFAEKNFCSTALLHIKAFLFGIYYFCSPDKQAWDSLEGESGFCCPNIRGE